MAKFKYSALNEKTNEIVNSEIEADSAREAREKIMALGFLPTKVFEENKIYDDIEKSQTQSIKSVKTDSKITHLTLDEKIQFTSQLEVLMSSQVPILDALESISESSPNWKIQYIAKSIMESIKSGLTLKESFERFSTVFDKVYIGLITTGEMSGNIEQTFERVMRILKKQSDVKSKVVSALTYPSILLCIMAGVVTLFSAFVIPRFAAMYSSMGSELPCFTKFVMNILGFFGAHKFILIGVIIASIYGIIQLFKNSVFKKKLDGFLLKIPIIKDFVRVVNLANFVSVMEVGYEAGIPIAQSIEMAQSTIGNTIIKQETSRVVKMINKGHTLYDSFHSQQVLDAVSENLIKTGEKSGELGKMFHQISENFDKKIDTVVDVLARSFEPIMLVVMGILVLIIALAFFPVIMGVGLSF